MRGYKELVSEIEGLLRQQSRVVVAISGFGGSGKSTLAGKICEYFDIEEKQVVRVDNLYGPNPNGPDIFDQSDWPLIKRILLDVKAGKRLKYEGKGYEGEILHFDEALPDVVVIEGIRLLQPELMPLYDIGLWIDCPQEFALERAKARDRQQGEDEETVSLWDTDWGPKDRTYFERFRPNELATFLYTEFS